MLLLLFNYTMSFVWLSLRRRRSRRRKSGNLLVLRLIMFLTLLPCCLLLWEWMRDQPGKEE